ncbi:MAG: GNAT family N-acetyltransferase [Pyrinomonadaceae bacterium]
METSIEIRSVTTIAEMQAVEELQKEVWGIPDIEVVPISQLAAAIAAGGCLLGAFDNGKLVGFAYGFVSYEKRQMAHHSHMLAVKPEYRNYKLGEKLKRSQREFVLRQGISLMSWTFDPLQSLNAYFNFNKLGVVSDQYFVNFYGEDAPSFLHQNGTDRLWVIWNLSEEKTSTAIDIEKVKRLVELVGNDIPQAFDLSEMDEQVAIEIPADINELQKQNIELAAEWRKLTRNAFENAFEKGFTVTEFFRGKRENSEYGVYLLGRQR